MRAVVCNSKLRMLYFAIRNCGLGVGGIPAMVLFWTTSPQNEQNVSWSVTAILDWYDFRFFGHLLTELECMIRYGMCSTTRAIG
jgi:hypothetical protein